MTDPMLIHHNVVYNIAQFGYYFSNYQYEGYGGKMKPVPDDPRFLYVLDPLWHQIKNIDFHDFSIYPIIGLSAISTLLLIVYLRRAWKDRN